MKVSHRQIKFDSLVWTAAETKCMNVPESETDFTGETVPGTQKTNKLH